MSKHSKKKLDFSDEKTGTIDSVKILLPNTDLDDLSSVENDAVKSSEKAEGYEGHYHCTSETELLETPDTFSNS